MLFHVLFHDLLKIFLERNLSDLPSISWSQSGLFKAVIQTENRVYDNESVTARQERLLDLFINLFVDFSLPRFNNVLVSSTSVDNLHKTLREYTLVLRLYHSVKIFKILLFAFKFKKLLKLRNNYNVENSSVDWFKESIKFILEHIASSIFRKKTPYMESSSSEPFIVLDLAFIFLGFFIEPLCFFSHGGNCKQNASCDYSNKSNLDPAR